MSNDVRVVFVTKHALTKGILRQRVLIEGDVATAMSSKKQYKGHEYWISEEDAKKHAHSMKKDKMKRLQKEIRKLKDTDFLK
jgi:hypothetical protein